MATAVESASDTGMMNGIGHNVQGQSDPFVEDDSRGRPQQPRRYSSHFDPDSFQSGPSSSPSHVKRTLEAHLLETERRLQDTQKLGTSLLQQQSELTEKLKEVEKQQDEAEITPELRQRLAELEKEHNDVGKEIARALIGPKSRVVSGEEKQSADPSVLSSQATASPTKVSAPSRKQRNQPSNRAGDLQFAADISTSLLAQVRQLQAAVADRDDMIKKAHAEQNRLEHEVSSFTQRLRTHDENEQRYKDENWNLEAQNHELLAAGREASEKEKKLSSSLAVALAEKSKSQSEMDEMRLTHGKLLDEHAAAKKSHDSELHGLKRSIDVGDNERSSLQNKIDELTLQNQELAHAVAARFRNQHSSADALQDNEGDDSFNDIGTPEDSPPPSPTKATPRHGGLESETLRSSLHHAHRMIQNLKSNIHREKTEKIELKRMLQDARDELEQRRTDNGSGSGTKKQKTKPDAIKKPLRSDMLGGSRRARTDIEMEDQDWEDHAVDSPSRSSSIRHLSVPGAFREGRSTDTPSDAYQTANDTEGAFETADERHGTESEDFQTGEESMAGDSTDDLTETEETGTRTVRSSTIRVPRSSLAFKQAGDRTSFMSTASTSAGEENDDLQSPIQNQSQKFRLRNSRQAFARQSKVQQDDTPESQRFQDMAQDSPSTITDGRSPPAAEQSLFAELGAFDDANSDRFGTPGHASITSVNSTPSAMMTPSKHVSSLLSPPSNKKRSMVDSGMMTEPWEPQAVSPSLGKVPTQTVKTSMLLAPSVHARDPPTPSPTDFPLPPSIPTSPYRNIDNGTQYTPQRMLHDSPGRSIQSFITPPKTVWDEAHDTEAGHIGDSDRSPQRGLGYSGVVAQDTMPISPKQVPIPEISYPVQNSYSVIRMQDTAPVVAPQKTNAAAAAVITKDSATTPTRPKTAEKVAAGAVTGGLLASAAAALGFSKAGKESGSPIDEKQIASSPETDTASGENSRSTVDSKLPDVTKALYSSNDQSAQTSLTAEEIENALSRKRASAIAMPVASPSESISSPTSDQTSTGGVLSPRALSRGRDAGMTTEGTSSSAAPSTVKRPSSSSGQRSSTLITQHPPLPIDHRTAIVKAGGRVTSPTREPNNSSHVSAIMGPPALPASAMRRPRTPAESSIRSPTREGMGPRASNASRYQRGAMTSQLSHRSSVSSFASEIDERFNIRTDAPSASHGFEATPGTDPRMIQAITQTMIGEFLWKYTRKAGRTEMSDTRHRRYFWVHPYTKTLYWSDQDPQTAGRNELKAKSVAIESVRVVRDDNPMPPGLHRKSLEVTTPGRKVKFTASTGQRHETWFNALSYLLLRGEDQGNVNGIYSIGGNNEITNDDINEFNVHAAGYGAKLPPSGSRVSMSSYNSRTTRGTSANRASMIQRQAMPTGVVSTGTTYQLPQDSIASRSTTIRRSRADPPQETNQPQTRRNASLSRFSRVLGSMAGRTWSNNNTNAATTPGTDNENGSIYNASLVSESRRDSVEEIRREMLKQEREGTGRTGGGLENVRACCDGKHDVSTLTHMGRHGSHSGHAPGHTHTHSRVMSFRGPSRRNTNNNGNNNSSSSAAAGTATAPAGTTA